jgi:long-chain acyl-CoA synthetase
MLRFVNSMAARTILPELDTAMATRAVVRLSRQVEITLSESQLSVAQFRVLDRLSGGSAAGRSLAEWLAVKPPSITALVDGLVARGLVARTVDEADRRRVTHELTDEGRDLHRTVSDALTARLNELVGHLDDAAVAAETLAALARWNEALDRAREAKRAARREDGA